MAEEVITNTITSAISTTVDVEIVDHRSYKEFPTLPACNNVRDYSPVPTAGRPSNGKHPSKHGSVPQTRLTPAKPWSQVLKQNAREKSNSLHQHPSK
ncbi:unnamed protein product, partial [Ilex paraguariensis]